MADLARPRFLIGPASTGAIAFPMATVAGLSLAECTPTPARGGLAPQPLLHQEKVWIDARTPGAVRRVELRLLINTARMGDAMRAIEQLWAAIGTDKAHLWIVDDDSFDVLTTANNEAAGAGVVVEYTAPAKTWFAATDYLFLPSNGAGSDDEIVVATAKTDGTPSFTATLAFPHDAGAVVYRVAACYPNSILESIRPSAVPLGKGTLILSFVCPEVPLFKTTLPS